MQNCTTDESICSSPFQLVSQERKRLFPLESSFLHVRKASLLSNSFKIIFKETL